MRLFGKGKKQTTVSSVLNIMGLTAAFASLYVITVQVVHDMGFNRGIRDSERIYLVTWGYLDGNGPYKPWICRPLAERVVDGSACVESGGIATMYVSDGYAVRDGESAAVSVTMGEFTTGGRETFGLELVAGSWDDMVDDSRCALSESTSRRLGVGVGDTFKLRSELYELAIKVEDVTVAAVYVDPPADSDLENVDIFTNVRTTNLETWNEWGSYYFVKLREGVSPEDAEREMGGVAVRVLHDGSPWEDDAISTELVSLVPIRDTYFSDRTDGLLAHGSRTTTWALMGIAVLIVAIAFINYVNFFFAQIPVRLREVNTRKIFGCSRARLVWSFVWESLAMVLVSLGIAAAAVAAFGTSPLADLISAPTAFALNPWPAVLTVTAGVVMSVAASIYPALYITSFNTAFALKGTLGTANKGRRFRTVLIGFQFTVSTVLIVCAIFMHRQRVFMLETDLGFDREQVLTVKTTWRIGFAREDIESALSNDPDVEGVAWSDGEMIRDSRMTWSRNIGESTYSWQCYPVSWNFLRFMGIEVVEGRDFMPSDEQSESGVIIFNETARDQFGVLRTGMLLSGHRDNSAELAGFCRNFHYSSLRSSVAPFALYVMGKYPWRPLAQLFVRTTAGTDIEAFKARLRALLHEYDETISGEDLDIRFLDEALQAQYTRERSLSLLMTLFTALAIVISLMGVFGLVMFETEHRRKEIGIRRVNGATIPEILKMFNRRFVRIVAVCFVVALPVSFAAVDRWLESYASRVPMSAWVFVMAMASVLGVTVCVVTVRSWRAATENPVKSLKNE